MRYQYPRKWTTVKIDGDTYRLSQEAHDNVLNYSKDKDGEVNWVLFCQLIKAEGQLIYHDSYQPTEEEIASGII